ncbi:MAG: leucine-rich repeat protein, partial [Ruminococcus sp.]|nr:leucine-rich repeat protein [Ruminococcus sp.]
MKKSFFKVIAFFIGICCISVTETSLVKDISTITYAEENTISGTIGDLKWSINDYILTISGKGDMPYMGDDETERITYSSAYPWETSNLTDASAYPWYKYGNNSTSNKFYTVVIEEGITSIAKSAFSGMSNILEIKLPSTLKKIEDTAFYGSNISVLYIPKSVTAIGSDILYYGNTKAIIFDYDSNDTPNISNIMVNYTFTDLAPSLIDNYKVYYALDDSCIATQFPHQFVSRSNSESGICGENLTWELNSGNLIISGTGSMYDYKENSFPWSDKKIFKIKFKGSDIEITPYAFKHCYALNEIDLSGVIKIEECAFSDCKVLLHILQADEIKFIGDSAFEYTSWLNTPALHKEYSNNYGLVTLGKTIIYCDDISDNATIPENISYVSPHAFSNCKNLKTLYIPKNNIYYNLYAFENNSSITHLRWSDSDTDISLEEFMEAGKNRTFETIYNEKTGETISDWCYSKNNTLVQLAENLYNTPYMDSLREKYFENILHENNCTVDSSDKDLIKAICNYLKNNSAP